MSQAITQHRRCDRCGLTVDFNPENPQGLYTWGEIDVRQINNAYSISVRDKTGAARAADICPRCLDELRTWWKNG